MYKNDITIIQDYCFGIKERTFFNKIKIVTIIPNVKIGRINNTINLKEFKEN
jgi:hypothetical protein